MYNPGEHPQVRASDPASWAHDTATRRIIHDIFPRLLKENDNLWPVDKKEKIVRALRELVASLESGSRGMLEDINEDAQCPDVSTWNSYILPSIPRSELNWMDAPWIVAEFYFYRRVVEAVQYYEITYDPFAVAKFDGLSSSLCAVERLCALYFGHLDGRGEDLSSAHYEIEFGVYCSLWGNKKDLSLWPAGRRAEDDFKAEESVPNLVAACAKLQQLAGLRVLENHIESVIDYISRSGTKESQCIGIVVDNAGYELCCDLLLGYILLKSGLVQSVIYYTKGYPTFVSDATTRDCMNTVNILRGMTRSINLNPHQSRDVSAVPTGTHSRRLGEELSQMVAAGRIRFQHDVFWCLPIHFASMPATVRRTIECNSILFIKGDANYRRLIDDRKCPFNTPSESVFKYWPSFIGVAMCALRSCKSEVCCGVTEDAQQKARAEDSTWLVSGEWGLIQFAN